MVFVQLGHMLKQVLHSKLLWQRQRNVVATHSTPE